MLLSRLVPWIACNFINLTSYCVYVNLYPFIIKILRLFPPPFRSLVCTKRNSRNNAIIVISSNTTESGTKANTHTNQNGGKVYNDQYRNVSSYKVAKNDDEWKKKKIIRKKTRNIVLKIWDRNEKYLEYLYIFRNTDNKGYSRMDI